MMRPDGSGKPLTAGDVRKRFANVTRGTDLILVGTPEQVADRIEEHAEPLSAYPHDQDMLALIPCKD